MCTSIVSNRRKTLIGWNLDILDMEYRVRPTDAGVFIEINDAAEGWMPLFGANARGDFVGMPTCWPHDERSDPQPGRINVINLDIDLLLRKRSLSDIRKEAEAGRVCSVPGLTFMGALSDRDGNLLQVVPGQGCRYLAKPRCAVMTNFSPLEPDRGVHPWMGRDRYETALARLEAAPDDLDVPDVFAILREAAQTVCPTVVSMVFDVTDMTVYWCEEQRWDEVRVYRFL